MLSLEIRFYDARVCYGTVKSSQFDKCEFYLIRKFDNHSRQCRKRKKIGIGKDIAGVHIIQIIMTLRIELVGMDKLPNKATIYVEGSEAGPLISKQGCSPLNFCALCNTDDILYIYVYENFKDKLIGEVTFSARRFLRQNKYFARLYQRDQITYKTNIFNKSERPSGILVFSIKYTPGTKFFGEKLGNFQSLPDREPVGIYKGLAQTKNMFSFCDQGYQNTPFHAVQQTYRDQTWGNRQL